MSDLLIRDVPDRVLALLDQRARALGLSRSEYLRRRLAQDVQVSQLAVTVDHWHAFRHIYCDLGNSGVMGQAWR